MTAKGSTAQVEKAFATRLGRYDVQGTLRRAPVGTPRIPRSIAAKVSSTLGLAQSVELKPHGVRVGGVKRDALRSLAAGDTPAQICSEWYGEKLDTTDPAYGGGYPSPLPYAPCGYTPAQIRGAYGFADTVRRGNDGSGVTIAIVDAFLSPTLLQDAQMMTWMTTNGMAPR